MLIEYIWIEDYGIIKGQGFNFNPNAEYAFDPNTTPRSLSRTEKPRVPENFFHTGEEKRKGTVSRVSALVGANGAGKTSVMAFLTAFLTNNRKDTCRGILVTTEGTFVHLSEKDLTLDFTGDWPEATEKFKEIRNGTGDILSEHIKDTGLFTFQGEYLYPHLPPPH